MTNCKRTRTAPVALAAHMRPAGMSQAGVVISAMICAKVDAHANPSLPGLTLFLNAVNNTLLPEQFDGLIIIHLRPGAKRSPFRVQHVR